jgi:hypothetical protein
MLAENDARHVRTMTRSEIICRLATAEHNLLNQCAIESSVAEINWTIEDRDTDIWRTEGLSP